MRESGRVVLHESERDMTGAVAEATAARHAAGVRQSVSTPTNDTAEAVNELVRDRLIAAGLVDNQTTAHGMDGLRMGRGVVPARYVRESMQLAYASDRFAPGTRMVGSSRRTG